MADTKQKKRIEELYEALKKNNKYVAQVCGHQPPVDPLQRISNTYNNTFLHMAIRFKQKDLVKELLGMLPKGGNHPLSNIKNNEGNTILHEVASSDTMTDDAKVMVNSDLDLLIARNDLGETPIFCAARHGQTKMFEFLAGAMNLTEDGPEDYKPYLRRKDGTTVLHISITTECFKLAHHIAKSYKYLITEKDQDLMTALQYLACNPTAFGRRKMKMTQGFEGLFGSTDLTRSPMSIFKDKKQELLSKSEESRYSLEKLVKILVEKDPSLSQENKGKKLEGKKVQNSQENEGQNFQENKGQNLQENKEQNSKESKKSDESPLFLATISNIQEIVEEILIHYPQTLEHTNKEGLNILQVAIRYRHIEIFEMVVKSEVFPRSLLSAIDDKGNSLLHLAGQKMEKKSQAIERMQGPAFQLQQELWFFQKVKSACKMHLTKPLNKDHKTAEELFAASNVKLHQKAREWLMRASENCTILSVFIATVAFAAAYTVPGGSDGSTGIPIHHSKPLFVLFILADVISLTLALTSVGIFLSILTSSFPLLHFETYLFKKLRQGIIFMIFSVSSMAVAFGATVLLIMTHNQEKVVWYVVAFLPVPIFFLSYSPLRSAALKLVAQNPYTEASKNFVANFLIVVGLVPIFLVLLFCDCICKPVCWICGHKSQPNSDTQSPQPTAADPLPQV